MTCTWCLPTNQWSFHAPVFGFAGATFCCSGAGCYPGQVWSPCAVLCSPCPCCRQELIQSNSTGFQWKYLGVTRVQLQCRRGAQICTGTTMISIWLSHFRACQDTVWLLDVLPQLSAITPCFQIQLLPYCWFSHSFCHTLYNVTTNCAAN